MNEPAQIVALGVAVAIVIIALAFAAPAIFTAFGLAAAAAKGPVTAAAALPAWLVTSTTVVVNVTLVSVAGVAAAKTVGAIRRHLFEALAVTMGALEGSVLESLEELWSSDSLLRIAFGAGAALLFTIGALFWHRKGVKTKIFAALVFLLAPLAAIARLLAAQGGISDIDDRLAKVPGTTWVVLAAIAGMIVATVLAHLVVKPTADVGT